MRKKKDNNGGKKHRALCKLKNNVVKAIMARFNVT